MKRLVPWLLPVCLVGCQRRPEPVTLTIFAASSLAKVVPELNAAFGRTHPDVRTVVNTGGSQVLRTQIEAAGGGDVFLCANADHTLRLSQLGLVGEPRELCRNSLVIAGTAHNQVVTRFDDLAAPNVKLVFCARTVPCGQYTEIALQKLVSAGRRDAYQAIRRNVVSEESDVAAAVAKLELGEADAGIVYRTDLRGTSLREIPLPASLQVEAVYTMAKIAAGTSGALADAYLDCLASPEGQEVLRAAGFVVPGGGK